MSTEKCQICSADSTPWIHIGGHICSDCYYAAIKLKKFEWVRVKDKLPDIQGFYLVVLKLGEADLVTVLYFKDKEFTFHENVSHWMPFPKPPNEK